MASFVDATKRPLSIPPRFVAYLEKHRIYELFQELAKQLMIDQPEDHIVYLKQCLRHAAQKRDIPRVILLAPPNFDKIALAEALQRELGLKPIFLKNFYEGKTFSMDECLCNEVENMALDVRKLIKSGIVHNSGWVFVDLPRTKKEARLLQRFGIIPTHVLQIIPSEESVLESVNDMYPTYLLHSHKIQEKLKNLRMQKYKKNLGGLREAYANFLIEIEVGIRTIDELAQDCAALTKIRKHPGSPSLFRIILIGSKGSGCRSLAKYLVGRFNIVHLDFNYILRQALLQETKLGEMVRAFEREWGEKASPEIRIQIVNKYVNKPECLRKGWVLTGYPITVDDFKLLDTIDTPPNRIIFVRVNPAVCKERLVNRRYNIITGSKHDLTSISENQPSTDSQLAIHPKDYKIVVEKDLEEFEKHLGEMLNYAGDSAFIIDGDDEKRVVCERVEACLMRALPSAKPREPRPPPMVDPYDIEFDPSDEPDINIFEKIMPPERKYSFI